MDKTEIIDFNNLTNDKTKPLYFELANKYEFEILRLINPNNESKKWSCDIKGKKVQIIADDNQDNIEFFTHELLHVYLVMNGLVESTIIYNNLILNKDNIQYLFLPEDIGHINNTLAHKKMLPLYFTYDFEVSKFTTDYYTKLNTQQIISEIESELPKNEIPNSGITAFICQFFSLRFLINDNFRLDYSSCLKKLSKLDHELFEICEKFAQKWEETNDLSLNYILFEDLINGIENWLKTRKKYCQQNL